MPLEGQREHVGDPGSLETNREGIAGLEQTSAVLSFDGPDSIVGGDAVVHASPDDLNTQPMGNAGVRVACGTIGVTKE